MDWHSFHSPGDQSRLFQWSSNIAPVTLLPTFSSPTLTKQNTSEALPEAATDTASPFDCKCTSYTSRSPLGMAASSYGRPHELHGSQHFHQFGALFLHDSSGSGGCIRGYHHLTAICWVCCGVFSVGGLGRGSGLGVDPPHNGSVAVTFPQILNQRLSRVRSAVELFVLVDCHSEADVDIWTATMASTSSQLHEKVADLPYRRGPDQPSSSSLARRVRVQPLLLSLLLFVR